MLGHVVGGRSSNSIAGNRNFRYEVVGLHQSNETDQMDHAIRSSASVFITVPFSRMNEEMQRITRMGGKIVSIEPLSAAASSEG
jgi:phycocyanin-associated, rod